MDEAQINKKKNSYWNRLRQKAINLFDMMLLGLSTILTIAVFFTIKDHINWFDWPLFLDRILFFVLLFFLISLIVEFVRGIIIIALIIVSFILIFFPGKTEKIIHTSSTKSKIEIILSDSERMQSYEERFSTIEKEVEQIKAEHTLDKNKLQKYYTNKLNKQIIKYQRINK